MIQYLGLPLEDVVVAFLLRQDIEGVHKTTFFQGLDWQGVQEGV